MNRSKRGHAPGSVSISSGFGFFGGLTMATYPVRDKLPISHTTEIGRIITRWAFLEWLLRQIAYLLLGLNPKAGRLAVRDPRATDCVTMIEDLVHVNGLKIRVEWKLLRRGLDDLSKHRHRLAHGVWLKIPGQRSPCLQIVKDTWQPNPNKPSIKAKIDPISVPVTASDLHSVTRAIESAIRELQKLAGVIDAALRALREIPDELLPPDHPHPHTEESRPPPRSPSRT